MISPRRILLLAFVCSLAVWARSEEPATLDPDSHILAKYSVTKGSGPLLVPVTVFKKTYRFILDTGSSECVYDLSLPLGTPIGTLEAATPGGKVVLKKYCPPVAKIGDLSQPEKPVICLPTSGHVVGADLSQFQEIAAEKVDGILGMSFLKTRIVRIDFDKGEVQFLTKLPKDPGTRMDIIDIGQNLPGCYAELEGAIRAPFVIDTGCFGHDVAAIPEFNLAISRKKLKVVSESICSTLVGVQESRIGRGVSLAVGDFRIANPVLGEGGFERGALGTAFLSRFQVIFDFPNHRMYLTKGKDFGRVDRWNLSGLQFFRRNGRTLVHSVTRESAAAEAGLRAGDVLLKIGGCDLDLLSLPEFA